jgi:hypothetical protein
MQLARNQLLNRLGATNSAGSAAGTNTTAGRLTANEQQLLELMNAQNQQIANDPKNPKYGVAPPRTSSLPPVFVKHKKTTFEMVNLERTGEPPARDGNGSPDRSSFGSEKQDGAVSKPFAGRFLRRMSSVPGMKSPPPASAESTFSKKSSLGISVPSALKKSPSMPNLFASAPKSESGHTVDKASTYSSLSTMATVFLAPGFRDPRLLQNDQTTFQNSSATASRTHVPLTDGALKGITKWQTSQDLVTQITDSINEGNSQKLASTMEDPHKNPFRSLWLGVKSLTEGIDGKLSRRQLDANEMTDKMTRLRERAETMRTLEIGPTTLEQWRDRSVADRMIADPSVRPTPEQFEAALNEINKFVDEAAKLKTDDLFRAPGT